MQNVRIPVLLVWLVATLLILLDYYVLTPGGFSWVSHAGFWPAMCITLLVVYFAFRNESLNEKARRGRAPLWLLLPLAAQAISCQRPATSQPQARSDEERQHVMREDTDDWQVPLYVLSLKR